MFRFVQKYSILTNFGQCQIKQHIRATKNGQFNCKNQILTSEEIGAQHAVGLAF
jgi:hypothetical protein